MVMDEMKQKKKATNVCNLRAGWKKRREKKAPRKKIKFKIMNFIFKGEEGNVC